MQQIYNRIMQPKIVHPPRHQRLYHYVHSIIPPKRIARIAQGISVDNDNLVPSDIAGSATAVNEGRGVVVGGDAGSMIRVGETIVDEDDV